MMSFDTPQDLFFLALAIAVLVLTFLLAWLLVYIIAIFRSAKEVTGQITAGVSKIHTILDSVHETVRASSMHLSTVVAGVRELIGFFGERRKKKSQNKKRNDAADDVI